MTFKLGHCTRKFCKESFVAPHRLVFRSEYVSPHAAALKDFEIFKTEEGRVSEAQAKIDAARDERMNLVRQFQGAGLRVIKVGEEGKIYDVNINDEETIDAEGKLINTDLRLLIKNEEEAVKAVALINELGYMPLPIGGRSSGLGEFNKRSTARMNGCKGVIGLQLKNFGELQGVNDINLDKSENPYPYKLEIPEYNKAEYELIRDKKFPIAVLQSRIFPEDPSKPHRVIVHAGVSIYQVNLFLSQAIPDDRYRFELLPDPTSKKESQIGGNIMTGAQGGNRFNFATTLRGARIINGSAEAEQLGEKAARSLVGTGGSAGMIMQAEIDVVALPKHQHSVFIPIEGQGPIVWFNMMRVQQALKRHAKKGKHFNLRVGGDSGLIVTAAEMLSFNAYSIATQGESKGREKAVRESISGLMQGHRFGLYVTYSSFHEYASEEFFRERFFTETLGIRLDGDGLPTIEKDGSIAISSELEGSQGGEPTPERALASRAFRKVRILNDGEHDIMDRIRHSAPETSKKRGKELGVTQSTDFNIQFTSEDPSERAKGMWEIAKICAELTASFDEKDGFKVAVYGHDNDSEVDEQGGFGPHIRVMLELSDPRTRDDSIGLVERMKKARKDFYKKIFSFNGKYGIRVMPPEKGLFTNETYWEWLRLNRPERACEMLAPILRRGYAYKKVPDGEGGTKRIADRPTFAARKPDGLHGVFPRLPGGIEELLDKKLIEEEAFDPDSELLHPELQRRLKAIFKLIERSHRSAQIKRLLWDDFFATLHEKCGLAGFLQSPLVINSPEHAAAILEENFGAAKGEYRVQYITVDDPSNINPSQFTDRDAFYVVSFGPEGALSRILGMSVLIAPHAAVQKAAQLKEEGKNKSQTNNLYDMWLSSLKGETKQTPQLLAIAAVSFLLQLREFPNGSAGVSLPDFTTFNPGPTAIAEAMYEGVGDLVRRLETELGPARQAQIIERLKRFMRFTDDYSVHIGAAAHHEMERFAERLAARSDVRVAQVVNGAFGEKFSEILVARLGADRVRTVRTPKTTGTKSQGLEVIIQLAEEIRRNKKRDITTVVVETSHNTDLASENQPQVTIEALNAVGFAEGTDYLYFCDATSSTGAIDYATPDGRGGKAVRFSGMLWGFQKAFACPAGMAATAATGALGRWLAQDEAESVHSPLILALLGLKLDADEQAGRTIDVIQKETRELVDMVTGFTMLHPELIDMVQDRRDRSRIEKANASKMKNLVMLKDLLERIFDLIAGSGYGEVKDEAMRLYLVNAQKEKVMELLLAVELLLDVPEVAQTRPADKPIITLREPHEIAGAQGIITEMAEHFTLRDVFENRAGIEWLDRLWATFNANVTDEQARIEMPSGKKLYKKPPLGINEVRGAKVYGPTANLTQMSDILSLTAPDRATILDHYVAFREIELELRQLALAHPYATVDPEEGEDEDLSAYRSQVYTLEHAARRELHAISELLNAYFRRNGSSPIVS